MCWESLSMGEGALRVTLEVRETGGNGIIAFIHGGSNSHVGGMSMAVPRLSLTGQGWSSDVHQLCAPGHKDVAVAAHAAARLAAATGQVASVTVGIHVDDACSEEVRILTGNANAAVEAYLVRREEAIGRTA